MYVLKFVDGSTMEAHHASFTLINPLDPERARSEELVTPKLDSPFIFDKGPVINDNPNSGESWLRMKTPSNYQNTNYTIFYFYRISC